MQCELKILLIEEFGFPFFQILLELFWAKWLLRSERYEMGVIVLTEERDDNNADSLVVQSAIIRSYIH